MRTPPHRKPELAAWIQRQRKLKGWKPQDVADRLSAMNLPVTADTVKVWESNGNRRPSAYNLEGLEQLFGDPAPHTAGTAGSDTVAVPAAYLERIDDLVEAVRIQNALIQRLLKGPLPATAADLTGWGEERRPESIPSPPPTDPSLRAER